MAFARLALERLAFDGPDVRFAVDGAADRFVFEGAADRLVFCGLVLDRFVDPDFAGLERFVLGLDRADPPRDAPPRDPPRDPPRPWASATAG